RLDWPPQRTMPAVRSMTVLPLEWGCCRSLLGGRTFCYYGRCRGADSRTTRKRITPMTSSLRATPPGSRDVRMRGFQDRAEVEEVIRLLDQRVRPLPAEHVPVREAWSRVLTQDVIAEVAVPGFDRAAMDGYAVRAEETFGAGPYNPLELRVAGEALPG